MRLVMLGYFGFGNAGDEAVLAAEVAALRTSLGPETEFVVVSGDVSHTRRIHDLEAISRTDFRGIIDTVRRSDGLVSGGGSLLQDVTSARPVAFYGGVMKVAQRLRKPVFVYAQGLGPINRRPNRWLAGRALRSAAYVSLRDVDSVRLAESLGVEGVDVVPDPVLGLEIPAVDTRPAVAVALRPWDGQEHWLPPIIEVLKQIAFDFEVLCVPFHEQQDVELARYVASEVGASASVIEPDGGYRNAVTAIASCRAVLGMRLHALIVAAAAGRPFVALSYDPKVTAFANGIGQPVAATLPGLVDPALLTNSLRTAMTSSKSLELTELRAESRRPAEAIATLLFA